MVSHENFQLTFGQLEKSAIERMLEAGKTPARRDVHLLLQAASGIDRGGLIARQTDFVPDDLAATFESFLLRRISGEPVFRILGYRDFHGLRLALNASTLEPRDDTECLVETILELVEDRAKPIKILDMGTGTGAVGLALLSELSNAHCVATDISEDALEAASRNAQSNGLDERFATVRSDWFERVDGLFDIIVSNPPYIRSGVLSALSIEIVDYDPIAALDGGDDGLFAYRSLLSQGSDYLAPNGFIALEIGFDQKQEVKELASEHGWVTVREAQDLAGQDRVLVFSR